jgi:hypothetical protein
VSNSDDGFISLLVVVVGGPARREAGVRTEGRQSKT